MTILPTPITPSRYEPSIVPAAKPEAYPVIKTGSATFCITFETAIIHIADSTKPIKAA
jgi:hypothetical protein